MAYEHNTADTNQVNRAYNQDYYNQGNNQQDIQQGNQQYNQPVTQQYIQTNQTYNQYDNQQYRQQSNQQYDPYHHQGAQAYNQQDAQQYNQYNAQGYNQHAQQEHPGGQAGVYTIGQQNINQKGGLESYQQPSENPYYNHPTAGSVYQSDGHLRNNVAKQWQPQQLQQQQQQTVIIDQTSVRRHREPGNMMIETEEWSSGICGCFEDCCSCLYAFCCYQCFMSTLTVQMDEWYCAIFCLKQLEMYLPLVRLFTAVTGWMKDILCATVTMGNIFLVPMRTRMRTMYGIQGSILKDICAMCWCQICTALQMSREMKHRGQSMGIRNL